MPEFISNTLNLLQENPAIFITVSVLLGLMVGSFLNVVIYRLPLIMQREWEQNCKELQGQEPEAIEPYNLVVPRSACTKCGHKITAE